MARAPGRKKMAGIVIGKREITTRQGKRLAFVQFSDMSGVYEVSIFAEVLARVRELLETGRPLLLNVDARQDGSELRLNAQDISALDETVASASNGLRLYLNHGEPLAQLQSLLARDAQGDDAYGYRAEFIRLVEDYQVLVGEATPVSERRR